MRILNISNMPVWLWGKNKGIPSIFAPQKEYAGRGNEVYFLCPLKEGEPRYSLEDGVRVRRFDFPFNYRKNVYPQGRGLFFRIKCSARDKLNWLFFQIFAFTRAVGIASKARPDIVYAHSPKSAFCGFLISKLFSAKLVLRVYGVGELYLKHRSLWHRVKWAPEYMAFKVPADCFIITDDGSHGDLLASSLGVPSGKIKNWRNGIDQDAYSDPPDAKDGIYKLTGTGPGVKIIASTSRLIPEYGVERVVRALVEVFKKESGWICVIAGSGPDEAKLKEIVARNEMGGKFFFLGIVDRDTVKNLLAAAELFVFLPEHHNCTNTIWEAMASGKCIVTTETVSLKKVLEPGKDAVMMLKENMEKLPGVIGELLKNEELRKTLAKNARRKSETALEKWPERIEKELRLLEALAGGSSCEV